MKKLSTFPNLSNRELNIMEILWNSDKSLTASEIAAKNSKLTINTVQSVLRKLLKYELIEIAAIVYSRTVLSRSYQPAISKSDYALHKMTQEYQKLAQNISKVSLVANLFDVETDQNKVIADIEEMEKMLANYKKHLSAKYEEG